jgi:molybdopterin molybdotransferase
MISFDDAVRIVLANVRVLGTELLPLVQLAGRGLAEDIAADRDMPPREMSAMDGYACRAADVPGRLKVIETIAAGREPRMAVGPGQCSQIMTGAAVPAGADTVVMVEQTVREGDVVHIEKVSAKSNIRFRGEELREGAVVLRRGTRIGPAEIAVLATVGRDSVLVHRVPRVGVIATGDELVEPGQPVESWQIRNSNSWQLCAQIERAGGMPRYFGIAVDEPGKTRAAIEKAAAECDVVLISGGVSMGEFDFVPGVLDGMGVDIKFSKVAVQPGRPTVFGVKGHTAFFGLPGNPVSTFVLFELIVRPFLMALMGVEHEHQRVQGRLTRSMKRRKADRLSFRPVVVSTDGGVLPVEYHGSAHIHSYTIANGVVGMPLGVSEFAEGATVEVIQL